MASATSTAVGRLSVPLNIMCSRKCASPFVRSSSPRDPAPTKTLTLTDCAEAIDVVTTRRPPVSSLISGVMDILFSQHLLRSSQTVYRPAISAPEAIRGSDRLDPDRSVG